MLNKLNKIKQRETSGSDTFKNYDYQYHWAIYTLLENSRKNDDIAVLVEFHEDVILIENVSSENNQLHFFQIKANDKSLTLSDILRKENGNKSILDKLTLGKEYLEILDNIKSIKLVSANGFSSKFCANESNFYELCDKDKKKIENNLVLEIDKNSFLSKLYFSKSNLPKIGFIQTVKGILSEIIQEIHPDKRTNVNAIYLVLKDDLHDKGKKRLTDKEDPLQEKGMTFSTVKEVIRRYTDIEDDNLTSALDMLNNTSYAIIEKQKIKKELLKYSTHHLNSGSIQAQIKLDILNSNILDDLMCSDDKQLAEKIDNFCSTLKSKYGTISTDQMIKSGVLYELSRYIRETA